MTSNEPLVSVVMANRNGAAHIAVAVRSVLRSTLKDIELILSDDGSTDDSIATAREAASGDPRLIILRSERGTGPATARNRALKAARGKWIAIVDSDDIIHPERLERLVNAAAQDGADIVADDLLTFYEDGSRAPHAHLKWRSEKPRWVSAAAYEYSNRMLSGRAALGYLKPLYQRIGPDGAPAVYDETLRIAEDSDLILRLLAGGARMRVYPELGYFYRKHSASISHRLDVPAVNAIMAAQARIDPGADGALAREMQHGREALRNAWAFAIIVDSLKARKLGDATRAALKRPAALLLFKDAIVKRLVTPPRARARRHGPPRVILLSRQRIVGQTNGSSAYVLALASALKSAGYAVDYIGASPKIFGRWATMRLKPEIGTFASYRVRGGARVGPFVLATDPGVWIASGLAVMERLASKVGVNVNWSKPAEYAQGAAPTRDDVLFIARHASADATAVLCDYCFLTPLAPYALAPGAQTFTIMHDLMSARVADKTETNTVQLSAADEFRMLELSDVVLAIQQEEAAAVRAALPGVGVVLTPHAVVPADKPRPGTDDTVLFVGSNTAPNIVGLAWFFEKIWPLVRAARPAAQLNVAGSVARGMNVPIPEGVTMLGVVGDLEPLYDDAGVVISPLFTGSGLKIKLIEALAAGKAVVGTSVTAQGVETIVDGAMALEDDPARFAATLSELLNDTHARVELGRRGLGVARAHFSPEAACAEFLQSVRGGTVAPARKSLRAEPLQSQ